MIRDIKLIKMASGDSSLFAYFKKILLAKDFCDIKPVGQGGFGKVLSSVFSNIKRFAIKNYQKWKRLAYSRNCLACSLIQNPPASFEHNKCRIHESSVICNSEALLCTV